MCGAIRASAFSLQGRHSATSFSLCCNALVRPRITSRTISLIHTPIKEAQVRIAKVPNRSVLAIEGRDTIKLLQGLITNNIKELHRNQSLYCAFLNPQGRMLSTAFIFSPKDDCALVDLDSSACSGLLAFIKRFKLRSKVTLKDVSDEYQVWATWGKDVQMDGINSSAIIASGHDDRSPLMGHRFLTNKDASLLMNSNVDLSSSESYTIHRILQGVPDGCNDIWENQSLPLEVNADFMNAVDFRKGCYVGQELTARTHHTGVVRKRVVPISIYPSSTISPPDRFEVDSSISLALPNKGAEVRSIPINDEAARGKSTGKYLSGVHNIGLALLRLDQVHRWNSELLIKVKASDDTMLSIRPWIPSWWPKEAQEPPQEQ